MTRFDASVVIPTRNRPALVRRAVQCMLDQQGVSVEVIVVDDASDSPITIERTVEIKSDRHRVCTVRNERRAGVAASRNRGLAVATSAWIGFCDDDDLWSPMKVKDQLEAVDGKGRWVCSGSANVDHDLTIRSFPRLPPSGDIHRMMLAGNVMAGGASNVMTETAWFRKLGGFDRQFSTLADWEAWIRLSSGSPLHVVPRYHVAYVDHADNMSLDVPLLWNDFARLAHKHCDEYERTGVVHDLGKWREYVIRQLLRRRAWAEARRESIVLAKEASPRAVMRTVGRALDSALPNPHARHRLALRFRSAAAPSIVSETERWLAPYRCGTH